MTPQPIYEASNLRPAYHLRYAWSGWPSGTDFPESPSENFLRDIAPAWETDGMRLLESRWSKDMIQLSFSATPAVSPVLVAARAKGRLQHALRTVARTPCQFSRKVAIRSIGDNTREIVEQYIKNQVGEASFTDHRFAEFLQQFTVVDPSVDLAQPAETLSGRYWYNMHLVLVNQQRFRFVEEKPLATLRDCSLAVAAKKGYRISALSVMPDHLHIALGGNIEQSPQDIALAFQNNLAYALGQNALWSHEFYVGTFSEYDMNAIRTTAAREGRGANESSSPAGQAGRDWGERAGSS